LSGGRQAFFSEEKKQKTFFPVAFETGWLVRQFLGCGQRQKVFASKTSASPQASLLGDLGVLVVNLLACLA
jgi:hypothetical protein